MRPKTKRHIGEYAFPALAIIATGAYLWDVRDISDPDLNLLLVTPLAWGVILVAIYLMAKNSLSWWREKQEAFTRSSHNGDQARATRDDETSAHSESVPRKPAWIQPAAWVGLLVLYMIIVDIAGFLYTTPFFLATLMIVMGVRSIVRILSVSIFTTIFFYVVFEILLGVPLP